MLPRLLQLTLNGVENPKIPDGTQLFQLEEEHKAGAKKSITPRKNKTGILQCQARILKVMKMWRKQKLPSLYSIQSLVPSTLENSSQASLRATQMSHLKLDRFFILLLLQCQIFAIVWNILLLLLFLKHSTGNISILTMEF